MSEANRIVREKTRLMRFPRETQGHRILQETGIISAKRSLDLSLRGRQAVAIFRALGDCHWDRHLAGHSEWTGETRILLKPLAMTVSAACDRGVTTEEAL